MSSVFIAGLRVLGVFVLCEGLEHTAQFFFVLLPYINGLQIGNTWVFITLPLSYIALGIILLFLSPVLIRICTDEEELTGDSLVYFIAGIVLVGLIHEQVQSFSLNVIFVYLESQQLNKRILYPLIGYSGVMLTSLFLFSLAFKKKLRKALKLS